MASEKTSRTCLAPNRALCRSTTAQPAPPDALAPRALTDGAIGDVATASARQQNCIAFITAPGSAAALEYKYKKAWNAATKSTTHHSFPRSASFGRNFDPVAGASSYVSQLRQACQGDLLALRSACVVSLVGAFAVGLLGVLSPFTLLSPLHLLTCLYLLPTSLILLALEFELPLLEPFYAWIEEWVKVLTNRAGRGAPLRRARHAPRWSRRPARAPGWAAPRWRRRRWGMWTARPPRQLSDAQLAGELEPGLGEDSDKSRVPRAAFRRRVLYGMERLDSAELVALCLELGMQLDARARSSALAALDPHEEGSIGEDEFIAWWERQQP